MTGRSGGTGRGEVISPLSRTKRDDDVGYDLDGDHLGMVADRELQVMRERRGAASPRRPSPTTPS